MIHDSIKAASDYLITLSATERALALKQLDLRVAAKAPVDSLEVPPPVRTLREYLAQSIPIPPTIISPSIVVRGEIAVMVARAGKGKTSVNIHRLIRWAAGLPMFDELPDLLAPSLGWPVRSLVIENEGAAGKFQEKLKTVVAAPFLTDEQRELALDNFLVWGDGGWSGMKVDDDQNYALLRRAAEEFKPDIIYMEPFRGLWAGNENDAGEMHAVMDRLSELAAEYSCAFMLVHHARKSGTGEDGEMMSLGRGSTVLEGHVATMENLIDVKEGKYRELSWSKLRHESNVPAPLRVHWDEDNQIYHYVAPEVGEKEMLDFLAENRGAPVRTSVIAEALGEPNKKINAIGNKLKEDGRVRRGQNRSDGSGTSGYSWQLTDDDEHTGLEI